MEIFILDKAIEWQVRFGNGYYTNQERKWETLSILEKKKKYCNSNEWSSLQWRNNWGPSSNKQLRWRKWSNQGTLLKEWFIGGRHEKTKKRTRNSVSKAMLSQGREK